MSNSHIRRWPDDPGSHVAFPDRPSGLVPDRGSRRRNAVNRLLCALAVAGIGAACWGLWVEYTENRDRAAGEKAITQACGGVVDGAAVMDLAGGIDRAKAGSSDDDSFHLLPGAPGSCEIYKVGRPGTSYGHFALSFTPRPNEKYVNVVGASDERPFGGPLDRNRPLDRTSRALLPLDQPLEDGSLGWYDHDSVTVNAVCGGSKARPTSLGVRARAMYEGEVSDAERARLADIAVDAARKAADRLGCAAEVADAPDAALAGPSRRLSPAARADGACAWYAGLLRTSARGSLPDRALASPTSAHAWSERCLLALSPSARGEAGRSANDGSRYDEDPWWIAVDSWFGDYADVVYADNTYMASVEQRRLAPGTAGDAPGTGVWWASSVCRGVPAVHTMSVVPGYDEVVGKRLAGLFRAYVDDVAERRGCTDVTFPKSVKADRG